MNGWVNRDDDSSWYYQGGVFLARTWLSVRLPRMWFWECGLSPSQSGYALSMREAQDAAELALVNKDRVLDGLEPIASGEQS